LVVVSGLLYHTFEMPKIVDHDARREELAAAVWRLVSREGLEAATVRRVAADAGWSTGALAHYFAGKDDLLRFAFGLVVERWRARVAAAGESDRARAMLLAALPLDAERRAEIRIWFSFLGLALARPELATEQRTAYRLWRAALADALRERGHADPDADAAALIALVDGLSVQAAFEPRSFPSARLVELVDESLGSPSR
jgi:AcrR family transcriptional regulator